MRKVLVLCLLAFMSCQKDIMDIAKCLYENPKVKEIIADFIVAIATKDFSKIWPKIKEALPELIPTMIKCITENEVTLQSYQADNECRRIWREKCEGNRICIAEHCG